MASPSRRYSASDIRRYARCPRQWWYEARSAEMAGLDAAEAERRMAVLRRRHGAAATDLPAYRLLADLQEREERLAYGRAAHAAHAARVARRRIGCALPVAGLLVMCLCIMLLMGAL